ncbi:unnamed protein product [Heterotrigona itama]|uniref:Uncharacterized protein n=1 Tax=Heterotrigona itama TaxID=395501 RepID=A0A6V7HGP9_9HYME|nr:unnamed protein product [Heterotrigona itama]
MAMTTPYLDAIQAIPGDTPGEKFRWIRNFIREKLSVSDNLEDIVESDKVPRMLVPLVQIQAAIMLNEKDPQNEIAYAAIAEALKSEDEMIVNKALQANSFFDGTNKSITNIRYFSDNLFSYVSLNTRARIIKTLALQLSSKKNSDLAEKFFVAVEKLYGVQQAVPLLLACNDSFTYNKIVEKRLVLNRQLVIQIFRKNPDLVVRYLKLGFKDDDSGTRHFHPVNIYDFNDLLIQLIKNKLDSFVELCTLYKKCPPVLTMNNKTARIFLRNGRAYLYENPILYIKMLPLKKISDECMEVIYPKLFPKKIKEFKTDDILKYLQYYREDKKANLFLRSYQQVYNKNILDEPKKITVNLLKILPAEERVRQARIKMTTEPNEINCNDEIDQVNYVNCWDCYLPVEESLPQFKEEISKESEMKCRTTIACEMIYCCHVNRDDKSLLKVLTYLKNRHSNEQAWFISQVFQTLLNHYDLPHMGDEYWVILRKMISSAHMRRTLRSNIQTSVSIVEAAIHHNILQNKNIDVLIDILVDLNSTRKIAYWNIIQKYPQCEKMCLEACINVVSQKYDSNLTPWREDGAGILFDLCTSIYHFNKTHVNKHSHIKRMTIADYPWLLATVENILNMGRESNVYIRQNLQNLFMKNDTELYKRFWPDDKKFKILTGEVFNILKRNPKDILTKWRDYLNICKDHWHKYHMRMFIKALRWYKEIPIKFAKQCLQDISKNEMDCLNILAILVHGETFSKIIEPLISTSKVMDVQHEDINYKFIQRITSGMRLANPPVPLTMLSKLCNLDCLSALPAFTNACRRTNAMTVISFSRILSTQRVAVRKHGIRSMYLVASREYMIRFLRVQWESEQNHSIRMILIFQIMQLFITEPDSTTWSLFCRVISTLTVEDEKILPKLFITIISTPDEYVADYFMLLMETVTRFERIGLNIKQVVDHISHLLSFLNAAICNLLPEYFIKDLIRKYIFNQDVNMYKSSNIFMIVALFPAKKGKFDERMNLFSEVFKEIVASNWNVPHPKHRRFYPMNNAFRRLTDIIVTMTIFMKVDERLVDRLLSMFISILEPQKDPRSYLQLVYCKEKISSTTPKEFGLNVGRRIDELAKMFSPFLMFFIIDVLKSMLVSEFFTGYDKEDIEFDVVEGLLEAGINSATLVAVKLFNSLTPNEQPDRYDKLMRIFFEYESPMVKSIVNDIINNTCID